ncbi:MAG: hypothetical protein HYY38_01610 [Rhodospirillales bacterium]|nr:hypothetical protein [Rhodospirillales bacterium]
MPAPQAISLAGPSPPGRDGRLSSVLFVAAMLLGMALYRVVLGPAQKQAP